MAAAPSSPKGWAQVLRSAQGVIACDGTRARVLLGSAILVSWNNSSGVSSGDCLAAFSGAVGAVGSHGADLFVYRDLIEQIRQGGCVTDVAAGDLDGPHIHRFLINADIYLATDTSFGAAVLAGVPLAFTLGLDAGAIGQKVQRTRAATIGDAYVQRPLATTQGAEERRGPAHPDQAKNAPHKAIRLSWWRTKQHLNGQAGLDRGIAETRLPPTFSGWRRLPHHVVIEPDRQRSPLLQHFVIGRPVRGLVLRSGPIANAIQLSC